ncbi:MAG TPA: hypothetical protein VFL84_03735, partial [Gammaproteobacteria bacterium]|nr:hypothetical protein [Gammaproteobacteria bacterium]
MTASNRESAARRRSKAASPSICTSTDLRSTGAIMATYIVLSRFTEQGLHSIKDTTKRADAV